VITASAPSFFFSLFGALMPKGEKNLSMSSFLFEFGL
jgi:hypothetical protein